MNRILLLLLFTFVSCTNREKPIPEKIAFPKTIHLELSDAITDSMNLSEIATRVDYIPLETTDSSLLHDFTDFSVTRGNFFIKDELRVMVFNNSGKFLRSLFNIGSGPGEANADFFAVDENGQRIFVHDRLINRVKVFDFNGKFIRTIRKPIMEPGYIGFSMGYFNNNLLVQTVQRIHVKYLYSCFDLENDSIHILCKNYRNYTKDNEEKIQYSPLDYQYQVTDSSILYKETYCDTIFSVNKEFFQTPRYIINLGKKKLDWNSWRVCAFNTAIGPPDGYTVKSFAESRSFLFLVLVSFTEPQMFVVYNKATKSTKIFKSPVTEHKFNQVYLKNDLDKIIPFPPMNKEGYLFYYNGNLYSVIEANFFTNIYGTTSGASIKSTKFLGKDASLLSGISETGNPIIVKVYLK
jgi:hypothetical protein